MGILDALMGAGAVLVITAAYTLAWEKFLRAPVLRLVERITAKL